VFDDFMFEIANYGFLYVKTGSHGPWSRPVNTDRLNRAPVNTSRAEKSTIVQCFFSAQLVNTSRVNSAPVFTVRVDGISTNQKIPFIIAALRIT